MCWLSPSAVESPLTKQQLRFMQFLTSPHICYCMSPVAESILDVEGVTPRIVADLGQVDFTIRHVRDDVADHYSEADLEEAYRLIMANQISGSQFRQIVDQAQYTAQSLFFDDLIVLLFPSERHQAVFASFDYREDFPIFQIIEQATDSTSAT